MTRLAKRLLCCAPKYNGILHALATTAAGAWSMRRLRGGYGGPCLNVRRDSDNSTQDIGFTASGELNTNALLTFVGNANGYVTKWYDQMPGASHLKQTQTVLQPQIINDGVQLSLLPTGVRPVVATNGGNAGQNGQTLVSGAVDVPVASLTFAQPFTRVSVFGLPGGLSPANSNPVLMSSHTGNPTELYQTSASALSMYVYDPPGTGLGNGFAAATGLATGSTGVMVESFNGASSLGIWSGRTSSGTVGANGSDSLQIGGLGTSRNSQTNYAEAVVFATTLPPADQAALTADQRIYWGTP
ncbi:arabinofuranosidase catalytic domain-containing protein [Paraburkholderia sp. J12]|uniref:arabinofuranosidase catalytic domain-containing protein n=1 Tax=Paraburkholderia sp. J12 TaxID=2805432 RepID=UPI002ABE6B9B|nr:arabinofuranosidase catalytic domain-containing protein [Paraburkholderia sp. J12]